MLNHINRWIKKCTGTLNCKFHALVLQLQNKMPIREGAMALCGIDCAKVISH